MEVVEYIKVSRSSREEERSDGVVVILVCCVWEIKNVICCYLGDTWSCAESG